MTEVSAEVPRQKSLLPLQQNTVEMTVNKFVRFPDTYPAEWRLMASADGQRNMTAFMTSVIGQEVGPHAPFSGDQQKDDYVRGFLVMHRMLRNQAELNGVELPDISLGTIRQYLHSVKTDTKTEFDNPQERFIRRKENARRRLADEDIMIPAELNQLTDGVSNPDIAFGAAEAYHLVKIAMARRDDPVLAKGEKPYGDYYSDKEIISEEDFQALKVSDITELIGVSYNQTQGFEDARRELFALREVKSETNSGRASAKRGRHRMGRLAQIRQGVSEAVGVVQNELDAAAQRLIDEANPEAVRLPDLLPSRETIGRLKEAGGAVVEGVQKGLDDAAGILVAGPDRTQAAKHRARGRMVQSPQRSHQEGRHRAPANIPQSHRKPR